MAKIRALKPETWTDGRFLRLSPLARLLFLGMWNLACDNGHLADDLDELKVRLLPVDQCDVGALVDELLHTGQVQRRDGFLKVVNLAKHQKPDMRYLALCEHCQRDETSTYTAADRKGYTKGTRRAPDVDPSSTQRAHDVNPTGTHRAPATDGDGDGDGDRRTTSSPVREAQRKPRPQNSTARLIDAGLITPQLRRDFLISLRDSGAKDTGAVMASWDRDELHGKVQDWLEARAADAAISDRPKTFTLWDHVMADPDHRAACDRCQDQWDNRPGHQDGAA